MISVLCDSVVVGCMYSYSKELILELGCSMMIWDDNTFTSTGMT